MNNKKQLGLARGKKKKKKLEEKKGEEEGQGWKIERSKLSEIIVNLFKLEPIHN